MSEYRPNTPYNVPAVLQIPDYKEEKGVSVKTYKDAANLYISFRTFGGTERNSNGQLVVENTGVVETWYRPDIKSDCRFLIEGIPYEIMGSPENINMRHKYMKIQVRAIKGGV